jgi:hypothetical protein
MWEVDTTQHTVRQPPQLGSKKNKNSKQPTGGSLYVIWVFLLLILYANRKNKFFFDSAKKGDLILLNLIMLNSVLYFQNLL